MNQDAKIQSLLAVKAIEPEALADGMARGHTLRSKAVGSMMRSVVRQFIEKLPDHYEDVDPATLKRLPVPY